jgi:hypothetical protein
MICSEHAILLAPPREFYYHPRVERGLVGLSPHVCSDSLMEWMIDGWRETRLPLDKHALIRSSTLGTRLVAREQKWYAHNGGAVKGHISRRSGKYLSNGANVIAINQSWRNRWVCSLTQTTHKLTKLTTLHVELRHSPSSDWTTTKWNDWKNEPTPTVWQDTSKIKDIIVPFSFEEDGLKIPQIAGLKGYDCPVYGLRMEYGGKITRYEEIITQCEMRLDEMTTGKAHRPDLYTRLDHTWSPAKVRRYCKSTRLKLTSVEDRFKRQLEPVAEAQAAVNKLVHERAWKAALLGALQAAELTVKKGDHDQ